MLSPSEEKMVNLGKFPTHENLKHNVELQILHDKPFLIAAENIKSGDELFFDYSYSYWKSFYD